LFLEHPRNGNSVLESLRQTRNGNAVSERLSGGFCQHDVLGVLPPAVGKYCVGFVGRGFDSFT